MNETLSAALGALLMALAGAVTLWANRQFRRRRSTRPPPLEQRVPATREAESTGKWRVLVEGDGDVPPDAIPFLARHVRDLSDRVTSIESQPPPGMATEPPETETRDDDTPKEIP